MWNVVRELMANRRAAAAQPSGSQQSMASNIDFEDMMEIYDAAIDDELEKFEGRNQRRSNDVSVNRQTSDSHRTVSFDDGRPVFTRGATRLCAYCGRQDCFNGRCRRQLDSVVDEDSERTPMLSTRSGSPTNSVANRTSGEDPNYTAVYEIPFADDSPRTANRYDSPRVPPAVENRRSYGGDTPPSDPPPSPPLVLGGGVVTMPESRLQESRTPAYVRESIGRYHHPGEGASPLIPETAVTDTQCMEISPVTQPAVFFRHLLKAIKNNNLHAVVSMCKSVLDNEVDLSDTSKFTEKHYTATVLHVALLYKRPPIAQRLIFTCPKLVEIEYTSEYLAGQTSFHIAAANNDIETMQLMLRQLGSGADGEKKRREVLDKRATGTYFERDHQEGALCLSLAIWAGHVDMLKLLFQHGASMSRAGPCGNTPLHHLIFFSDEYQDKQEKAQKMFELFWEYCDSWLVLYSGGFTRVEGCAQKALKNKVDAMRLLLQMRNDDEQTPLTLAVNLQAPIAKYLLNFENVYRLPQTKFGSTSWITYDVTDVTSYGTEKQSWTRYNPHSVLHILAHRAKIVSTDDKNFQDLIETQPIIDLVKMKWNVYQWIYYLWCLLHLTYMATLTWYATHYSPSASMNKNGSSGASSDVYNVSEQSDLAFGFNMTMGSDDLNEPTKSHFPWIFLIVPVIYIVLEMEDVIFVTYRSVKSLTTSKGFFKSWTFLFEQWTVTGNGPFRVLSLLFSAALLAWVILYELENADQDIALSFALIFGWVYMLFFTRAVKSTSRFSIMVQKMFFQDFLYFLSVYSFIWLAFASAMQALVHADERNRIGIGDTLYYMLNIVTDAGEKATEETARLPVIAAILLSCYAVISVILLLNMLIAMMNASYDAVKMSKTNLFRYQQLSILLMIERRLFWWRRLCHRSQKRLWSPKTTSSDEPDGRATPSTRGLEEIVLQVRPTKKPKLTPKRIYFEVTERMLMEDDSIYKPYLKNW